MTKVPPAPRDAARESEDRVLLVSPTTRDGEITRALLAGVGLQCVVCKTLRELIGEIETGAAVVLLTEDIMADPAIAQLLALLAKQPTWSDLALVLLAQGDTPSPAAIQALRVLTNVTLLERPTSTRSLVSAVQAAVRGRERQYQIRDQIESIRRAEAVSNELRRQLEIAVDASELGTFHCELPSGRMLWNERGKRHLWLEPNAEVDFDLFYSMLDAVDREAARQAVEACIYDGRVLDIELRTVSPQGQLRWLRATGRATYDEQRRPLQFDGTTQDITARKREEQALKDADRRKDEFLATLAHELRNPLAPIRNSLHLLRLSGDFSPSMNSVREIMERQVDQMVRIVDDLLDVSRISRGKIELRKEEVELATIISTAVETVQPMIDVAGHQLALSLPASPILLDADPIRLAQIIGNLLNNAAKYTPSGGQIWLTAVDEGDEAVISIRDTGLGIPTDMLPRIFDMFAQVDHTLTRAQGGLGIGLTLTKTFVEMHGGRIEAHSDGPGRGSAFILRLPMLRRAPQASAPTPTAASNRRTLPRRRIVIVDDTRAAAYVLGKLLEAMGQDVCTVGDAATALESVRRQKPDVLISDIAMPNMDGYELAQCLRKEPALDDLPLVALTGYGQDTDKQRAKDAGFDYHLVKPVGLDSLQRLLESLPAMRQAGGVK